MTNPDLERFILLCKMTTLWTDEEKNIFNQLKEKIEKALWLSEEIRQDEKCTTVVSGAYLIALQHNQRTEQDKQNGEIVDKIRKYDWGLIIRLINHHPIFEDGDTRSWWVAMLQQLQSILGEKK